MSISVTAYGNTGASSAVSGASMRMPPQQKMSSLYNQIDTSGAGSITQTQFNQAFQTLNPPTAFKNAGATAVWNALDPSGSGQVSQQNFINGMKDLMVQLRQGGGSSSAAQTSTSATQSINSIIA